jgi:hypothetical protein
MQKSAIYQKSRYSDSLLNLYYDSNSKSIPPLGNAKNPTRNFAFLHFLLGPNSRKNPNKKILTQLE